MQYSMRYIKQYSQQYSRRSARAWDHKAWCGLVPNDHTFYMPAGLKPRTLISPPSSHPSSHPSSNMIT